MVPGTAFSGVPLIGIQLQNPCVGHPRVPVQSINYSCQCRSSGYKIKSKTTVGGKSRRLGVHSKSRARILCSGLPLAKSVLYVCVL